MVSVPESLLITVEYAKQSDFGAALQRLPIDDQSLLLLWMMADRHDAESHLAPFWRALPPQIITGKRVQRTADLQLNPPASLTQKWPETMCARRRARLRRVCLGAAGGHAGPCSVPPRCTGAVAVSLEDDHDARLAPVSQQVIECWWFALQHVRAAYEDLRAVITALLQAYPQHLKEDWFTFDAFLWVRCCTTAVPLVILSCCY